MTPFLAAGVSRSMSCSIRMTLREENSPRVSIGLLGSGEFQPWTEEVDRWLLSRATGDGKILILPTASAPEGDAVFDNWADMGLRHYGRLGIDAEVLPVKTRQDTERPDLCSRFRSASMAYFSGGNPAYLAKVLKGSPLWRELLIAMLRGLAYTGCSAGMVCLGEVAIDSAATMARGRLILRSGLKLFRGLHFGPHWDALDTYEPGLRETFVRIVPDGHRLLAVDENTAVAGDGTEWRVMGTGCAYLLEEGRWREFRSGEAFTASLQPSLVAGSRQRSGTARHRP